MKRLALLLAIPLVIAACDNNPTAPARLAPEGAPSALLLPGCATPAPDQVRALISAVIYIRGLTPEQRIQILTPLFDAAKAIAARDYAGAISALNRFMQTIGGNAAVTPVEGVPPAVAPVVGAEPPTKPAESALKLPLDVRNALIAAATCVIQVLGQLPPAASD